MPLDPHNTADRTPHRNSVLRELREMQQSMYSLAQDSGLDARERATAALAYERLEQRRAVLKGKPGTITGKAEEQRPKPKRRSAFAPAPSPTDTAPAEPATPQPVALPPPQQSPAA